MKILAIVPIKFDGTSYYRAYGVFPNLRKHFNDDLDIVQYYDGGMGYSWADLLQFDMLLLQRPSLDAAKRIKLIDFFKKLKKKVWIDFDDNLFEVPMENRVYDAMTGEVKDAMFTVLQMADLITVSTEALKTYYDNLGLRNVHVVPNAWNFDLHGFADKYNNIAQPPPPQKAKLKIVWRGSETHQGDLASAGEAIVAAMNTLEMRARWTFMGYNPWMLTELLPLEWWNYMKSEDIMEYFRNLKTISPNLMYFPLRPNVLNFSKSNICWIEATYAGAVCIAPDWPEWKRPGVINYTSEDHLCELLSSTGDNGYAEKWEQSAAFIRENLDLDKVNSYRKNLLLSL